MGPGKLTCFIIPYLAIFVKNIFFVVWSTSPIIKIGLLGEIEYLPPPLGFRSGITGQKIAYFKCICAYIGKITK